MHESEIIALYFECNDEAIKESDALYGEKLRRVSYGITGDRRD